MTRLQPAMVRAGLLAETASNEGIAVRIERPCRPIGGQSRRAVVYAGPDVNSRRLAGMLRELADRLERGDP